MFTPIFPQYFFTTKKQTHRFIAHFSQRFLWISPLKWHQQRCAKNGRPHQKVHWWKPFLLEMDIPILGWFWMFRILVNIFYMWGRCMIYMMHLDTFILYIFTLIYIYIHMSIIIIVKKYIGVLAHLATVIARKHSFIKEARPLKSRWKTSSQGRTGGFWNTRVIRINYLVGVWLRSVGTWNHWTKQPGSWPFK